MSPKIWVLVDSRVGNSNQAIALADELGEAYETKNIEYNCLAKLPNFILALRPFHVKESTLKELKDQELPAIVISSGRRTAALASYLKKLSGGKLKIIQIMRPDINPGKFALIILPQHDAFTQTLPNVIRIIGALNGIQKKLPLAATEFTKNHPDLEKFIAVILGGSNKKWDFNLANAELLSDKINLLAQNHSMPLFISFSRRTPLHVKKLFREKFHWPHIIYDPAESSPNPYPGMIAKASYIITTADSISMCSEAAATGKPLYVFMPENFYLKKHKFFIQQLVDLEVAEILDNSVNHLEDYKYEPLTEITKVAKLARDLGILAC
jgi:hypothetical protein